MSDQIKELLGKLNTTIQYRVEIRKSKRARWLPVGREDLETDAIKHAERWRDSNPKLLIRIVIEQRVVIEREAVLDAWPKPRKK